MKLLIFCRERYTVRVNYLVKLFALSLVSISIMINSYYFYIMTSRLLEKFPTINNKHILLIACFYLITWFTVSNTFQMCCSKKAFIINIIIIPSITDFRFLFLSKKICWAHSKINSFRERMTQFRLTVEIQSAYPTTYTKALGLWTVTEILQQTWVQ